MKQAPKQPKLLQTSPNAAQNMR